MTVRIVDDLLDEEAWTEVWSHFQFADMAPVSRTAGAWKLDDGQALGGDEVVTLPQVPETMRRVGASPSERERIETEIIKSLISSYFDIVRKN
ncbi:MAG: hypothetical protein VXZ39_12740, partial [Planctomycetota bacterium]|nr:hypothetical protein [Planctomycetota bacterium]